jgi:circadian clock protein KaiC
LALADHPAEPGPGLDPEVMFHPLAGCVINVEQEGRTFGNVRRRLRVVKARALPHNGGYHDFKICTGQLDVYPRLGAYELPEHSEFLQMTSGIESIDTLLGGGLNSGTSCLIVGPSGIGKSTLAALYAAAVANAGEHAAIFLLDERPATYITRSELLGVRIRESIEAGRILIRQLDPGEIAPGEFAQLVREQVELQHVKVVIIDSVIGYFAAMGSADVLVTQLHELITYLTRSGVLLIMCGSQESFMSIGTQRSVDVSYLSDTILAMTFFEAEGELRRAIAVVKKKQGPHQPTICELSLREGKIYVTREPLRHLGNVMVQRPMTHTPMGIDGENG